MKTYDEKARETYNQKADDYDNSFEGRFTQRFKELLLEEISISPGDHILDMACGNGTLLKMLCGQNDIHGYGADISVKMIENARNKCPGMIFEVSDSRQIPFPDQMFDTITVCAAYHHFPDVRAFAREVDRLLKPRGRLYIAEIYYGFFIRAMLNPIVPLSKAGDVRFYSTKEIAANFEAHGFKQTGLRTEGHIQVVQLQRR